MNLNPNVSMSELVDALQGSISGDVRVDRLTRQLYSTDASDYRRTPAIVVIPRSLEDVATAMRLSDQYKIGLIARGGGSSLSGQTVGTGLILDLSKYMNRLLEVNVQEKWVRVEAGMVLDRLNADMVPHGLMVGPDPSSSSVATIGGMTGNNSTGSHSIKYGMMADHIMAIQVVLSDGSVVWLDAKTEADVRRLADQDTLEGRLYREIPALVREYRHEIETRYPKTWRNVAGYNLNRLLKDMDEGRDFSLAPLIAGSEGTLAVITQVKVRLVDRPKMVCLMLLQFDSQDAALERVPFLLEHRPSAVELMTHGTIKLASGNPAMHPHVIRLLGGLPGALLIVEFTGATEQEIQTSAQNLEAALRADHYGNPITHCTTQADIDTVWNIRKSVLGLLVSDPTKTKRIWIIDDATVPVDRMVSFTHAVARVGQKYGIDITFDAHASVGCLHMGLEIDLKTERGHQLLETLSKEIIEQAIAHGGTSTGEHGEGLARSYFTEQLYGERLYGAFAKVKHLFDPHSRLNPNKIIDPILPWDRQWHKYTPDHSLPLTPKDTYFDFSTYNGYDGLVEMCNGQGSCRSLVNGTMCPSFRLTRDEMHSTRGRANALKAALAGEFGPEGFTSDIVYEVLDLCLACKACKAECSTQVDLAKLKMEFLAHYQDKHGIPLRSRVFSALGFAGRMGGLAPDIANRLYRSPALRRFMDRTLAIDERRSLPEVASRTFQAWFNRRQTPRSRSDKKIVLWDDCHISYHQPHLGQDAVRILEAAGYDVICIARRWCCGRPMLSKGLLKQARRNARHNTALLYPYAKAGIPIVGVEPSCIACFREEYPSLMRSDEADTVAAQSYFFEEFICRLADQQALKLSFIRPLRPRDVLVHTHCYQKAFGTAEKVIKMLRLLPDTRVSVVNSGCCGMAGTFGYEKEHYDISMAIGEMALFPAVRAAGPDTIIAAAGTSCRDQIKDGTERTARHPISILAQALA